MTHKEVFLKQLKFDFNEQVQSSIESSYSLSAEEYERIAQMIDAGTEAEVYLAKYPKADVLTKKQLAEVNLFNRDMDDIINLWNEYCKEKKDDDNHIHYNVKEYFDEYFIESAMEAVRTVLWGNYNIADEYFYFKYNAIQTFSFLLDEECPIDRKKLTEWILKELN